jgi:tetratricopeptide (TPR) repeat protein
MTEAHPTDALEAATTADAVLDLDRRIEAARAELEVSQDRHRQAVTQYELGTLHDAQGDEGAAVREYLAAYNLDPSFRPPLLALVSIFERRRSFKNLARLYDAEVRSATSPAETASARVDQAVLMADHLGDAEGARELLLEAYAQAPRAAGGGAHGGSWSCSAPDASTKRSR